MTNRYYYYLFYVFLATVILWQLLLPGYILTLDMVIGPNVPVTIDPSGYYNFLPLSLLLSGFHYFLPTWFIQKIILFLLFFLLGFLSFEFLPVPPKNTVRLFSSLFYTINPFVYTRFLAGHWMLLYAYALLPPFLYFLLSYRKNPTFKTSFKIFFILFLICIFSLHIFVIAVILLLFFIFLWSLNSIYHRVKGKFYKNDIFILKKYSIRNLFFGTALFFVLNTYWIFPAIINPNRFENRFSIAHFYAFAPTGHESTLSPLQNILFLHGFWAEETDWGHQFHWLANYGFCWPLYGVFFALVVIGAVSVVQNKETRKLGLVLIFIGVLSVILSTGVASTPFQKLNLFLYQSVPFWKGFRDSQKFTGVLALSYTIFSAFGVNVFFTFFEKHKMLWFEEFFRIVVYAIIFFFGFFIWGGFRGQIRPIWYPSNWYTAKKIIDSLPTEEKVLFLPWHGYLSFHFNNNLLLANPAQTFFGPKAIMSKSIELKGLYDQETDPWYRKIDTAVVKENLDTDQMLSFLLENHIKYIVLFEDLQGKDPFFYQFLNSPKVQFVLKTEGDIGVYRLQESPEKK